MAVIQSTNYIICNTRKYPHRGYIHSELMLGKVGFDILTYVRSSVSPSLIDPMGLRVTQNAYFSLMTHTKQLLFVTF